MQRRASSAVAAADWVYLLPSPPRGKALCLGGAVPAALALLEDCRISYAADAQAPYDLIAVLHPAPRRTRTTAGIALLASQLAPGGTLYLELARGVRRPAARLRRSLEAAGLETAARYWPRRGFREADLWLPLGERSVHRYYLREMFIASSADRRLLRWFLRSSIAAGMFEPLLPGHAVVAVRPGGADAGAG